MLVAVVTLDPRMNTFHELLLTRRVLRSVWRSVRRGGSGSEGIDERKLTDPIASESFIQGSDETINDAFDFVLDGARRGRGERSVGRGRAK